MVEADLVGLGVGGARRGGTSVLVNEEYVPMDKVNVSTFLGVAAGCAAKKILSLLPGLESVVVALAAMGSMEAEEIRWLEVIIRARGRVSEEEVLGVFWRCPIMMFLRDKIRDVRVEVEGSEAA